MSAQHTTLIAFKSKNLISFGFFLTHRVKGLHTLKYIHISPAIRYLNNLVFYGSFHQSVEKERRNISVLLMRNNEYSKYKRKGILKQSAFCFPF